MNKTLLTLTSAGLIAFAGIASADKEQRNPEIENLKLAGSFLTSRINTNNDESASSWCTSQIKGGYQGSSMMQCVNEDVFAGFPEECPGGLFVVNDTYGGTGAGVRTFPNGEDQLFTVLTERSLCANQYGQITNGLDNGLIIGGTGRYAGVTGTYELSYTGQIMYGDENAMPPQYFGSLNGTGTWVINFPD